MSKTLLAKTIGNSIVHRRQQLNLSQKELSVLLNITQDSMSRIERGVVSPKMERLTDIADILQCSVSSLFQITSTDINERALAIAESLEHLTKDQQEAVLSILHSAIEAVTKICPNNKGRD